MGRNLVPCCMRKFFLVVIGFSVNRQELILMGRQTSQIKCNQLNEEILSDLASTAGNKVQSMEYLSKSLETLSSYREEQALSIMENQAL